MNRTQKDAPVILGVIMRGESMCEWNPNGNHKIPQAKVKLSLYDDDGYHHTEQALENYVEGMMFSNDVRFEHEALEQRVDKIAEAFGKLIAVLTEKKVINEPDIKRIVTDCVYEISLF